MNSGSRPQMRRIIMELMDRLSDAEFEAEMHRLILNGELPGSARILERKLARAREQEISRPFLVG